MHFLGNRATTNACSSTRQENSNRRRNNTAWKRIDTRGNRTLKSGGRGGGRCKNKEDKVLELFRRAIIEKGRVVNIVQEMSSLAEIDCYIRLQRWDWNRTFEFALQPTPPYIKGIKNPQFSSVASSFNRWWILNSRSASMTLLPI